MSWAASRFCARGSRSSILRTIRPPEARVASHAMVTNPTLVLADEPTGALDSKNSKLLLERFDALNKTYGTTILMRLGAGDKQLSRTLFAQVATYFLVPGVVMIVHDIVGFTIAGALLTQLFQLPEECVSFPAVLVAVLVAFAAYLALTYAACRQTALSSE